MRRSLAITLTILLLASLGANAVLLRRAATLTRSQQIWAWGAEHDGNQWGSRQAERDFNGRNPAYYVTGEFYIGDAGAPPMLTNKPGRVVVGLGCEVTPFDSAFVRSYNQRMDALFATRPQAASKP